MIKKEYKKLTVFLKNIFIIILPEFFAKIVALKPNENS